MILYRYNSVTGEFMDSIMPDIDPVASKIKGETVYFSIINTTEVKPPEFGVNETVCFVDGQWEVKTDKRGEVYFNANGEEYMVEDVGEDVPKGCYTESEWIAEQQKKTDEYESRYDVKRRSEYPKVEDYLDAKVKQSSDDPQVIAEGEAQEQAYLSACLAVKAKYHKPVEE